MSSKKKVVWRFTNGIELNQKGFCSYFEKKVFKTIRRFNMLKDSARDEIPISPSKDLNTVVLNSILKSKFKTKISKAPIFSSENLSDAAEDIFFNLLRGKFKGMKPSDSKNRPLYYLSDEEVKLYATIKKIKGAKTVRNKKIQELFSRFKKNNPDLEHNIVNAFQQIQ